MINYKLLGTVGALGWVFGTSVALAGTIFLPPPSSNPVDQMSGETFPESHFGSDPNSGDITQAGYAARQVNDMETPDEENGRVSGRGLASVGGSPNSGSETPIITTQAGTQDVSDSTVMRKGVQEVSIIASDLGYFPKTVFVSRDVPVRMYITSSSKNTLCIMMDSFQVRRQVKMQKIEEVTFVPNVPGKYRFYCPVNGMEGSLVVRELSSSFAEEGAPVQPLVRYQGVARPEERPRDPNAPVQRNTQSYQNAPSYQNTPNYNPQNTQNYQSTSQSTVSSRVPAGSRAVPTYQADWNPNNAAIMPDNGVGAH